MPIVKADLIEVDEARQNRDDAQREMVRLLEDLYGAVAEIEQRYAKGPTAHSAPVFRAIRVLGGSLIRDYEERANRLVKFSGANKQTQRILALFGQLPVDLRVDEAIVQAETCAVLAHASARRMADAADILADPKKTVSLNSVEHWTFDGERERIAGEFAARFPVYRGFPLEVQPRFGGFLIRLHCPPAEAVAGGETPMQGLVRELETFLAWELRKTGYDMEYENFVSDTPENKIVICTIRMNDTEDGRPSPEQVRLSQAGDGNSRTVSTGNDAIAERGGNGFAPAQREQLIGSGPQNTPPGLDLDANKIAKSDIQRLLSFLNTLPTEKDGEWEDAGPREEGIRELQKLAGLQFPVSGTAAHGGGALVGGPEGFASMERLGEQVRD